MNAGSGPAVDSLSRVLKALSRVATALPAATSAKHRPAQNRNRLQLLEHTLGCTSSSLLVFGTTCCCGSLRSASSASEPSSGSRLAGWIGSSLRPLPVIVFGSTVDSRIPLLLVAHRDNGHACPFSWMDCTSHMPSSSALRLHEGTESNSSPLLPHRSCVGLRDIATALAAACRWRPRAPAERDTAKVCV